jgi:hypothetical protein
MIGAISFSVTGRKVVRETAAESTEEEAVSNRQGLEKLG